jgi:hypothetical protein
VTVSTGRRFWRHLSGYYDARRDRCVRARIFADRGHCAQLEALRREIAEDGDMQVAELIWLESEAAG